MQLKKLSLITSMLIASSALLAEDYASIQYIYYDEDSGRTSILVPSVEVNKDFGSNFTLNLSYIYDAISGASPTYYDGTSGASASSQGSTAKSSVRYGDIYYKEQRHAFSTSLTTRFPNRDEFNLGVNVSREYDYKSDEVSGEYLHWLDASKNQSISFGASYQQNEIEVLCSLNNSDSQGCDTSSSASTSVDQTRDLSVISAEVGFTQVVDRTSLLKSSIFYSSEDGYLSNPYMRVVRHYNTSPVIIQERKPDQRVAYGATLQYAKAFGSDISTITSYRYYSDDWGIDSHTIGTELYYELSEKLITSIGLRYYTQSEATFYSGSKEYFKNQTYASSDRRISSLYSLNYKAGLDYKLSDSISMNFNASLYSQPQYFNSMYYNIGAKYRF